VGVYGVITLLVAGRTREIGIRMALGADRRDIGGLVVRSTLRLAAAGVAFGLALAAGSSRWIESQVFGVSPTDPATYAVVTVSVLAAALVAAWPPARRAVRIDPTIALKAE
jgi:ABC-type antimicrobial peptide transport system permease subunit